MCSRKLVSPLLMAQSKHGSKQNIKSEKGESERKDPIQNSSELATNMNYKYTCIILHHSNNKMANWIYYREWSMKQLNISTHK